MNELETKTEKNNRWSAKKRTRGGAAQGRQNRGHCCRHSGRAGCAGGLYVNGKLDLLRYDDGSVSEMGEIGADEDQDLDGTGLTHTESEMTMPEGSPFSDDNVLNILLVGTDERTEAVNDADAFTHLNQLDGTEDTTEFSDDARATA